jgi:hypothetical protein
MAIKNLLITLALAAAPLATCFVPKAATSFDVALKVSDLTYCWWSLHCVNKYQDTSLD